MKKILGFTLSIALILSTVGFIAPSHSMAQTIALNHSMAQTPYMGWSSYSQMVYDGPGSKWITAEKIKQQSDAMHAKLQSHGYEYINIDAGWSDSLDGYGRPVSSKTLYPMGFQDVIDYVHKNRQKIGIYMIPGLSIDAYNKNYPIYGTEYHMQDIAYKDANNKPVIMDAWNQYTYKIDFTKPGAQSYVDSIVNMFGGWGINFVKFDSVTPGSTINNTSRDARDDVKAWSQALTRNNIWFELSWSLDHNYVDTWKKYANGWRVDSDIEAYDSTKGMVEWPTIARLFPDAAVWWRDAGPGGWNDFDSLDVGNGSMNGLTRDERQTAATLWAVSSAQFSIGDDMSKLDNYGLQLLTNDEVIAVDQGGRPAHPVSMDKPQQVWYSNNGDGTYNVALFNLGTKSATITVNWSDIGLNGPASVRDLWSHKELGTFEKDYTPIELEPHASRLFKVTAKRGTSVVNDDDTGITYTGSWSRNGGNEVLTRKQDLEIAITRDVPVTPNTSTSDVRYTDINNDDSTITYNGSWSRSTGRGLGDYKDDVQYTQRNGDSFEYTFKGTGISVITEKDNSQGLMEIFVDSVSKGTVDTNNNNRLAMQTVYSISGLSNGLHTIKTVKISGDYMLLDELRVEIPNLISPITASFNENPNAQADIAVSLLGGADNFNSIFNGGIALVKGTDYSVAGSVVTIKKEYLATQPTGTLKLTFAFNGDYQNDVHYTKNDGDSFQYSYEGTGIKLLGSKGPEQGDEDIYVDGVLKKTVSTHSDVRQVQQNLYEVSDLSKGKHIIKVVKKSGSVMLLDQMIFTVVPGEKREHSDQE